MTQYCRWQLENTSCMNQKGNAYFISTSSPLHEQNHSFIIQINDASKRSKSTQWLSQKQVSNEAI